MGFINLILVFFRWMEGLIGNNLTPQNGCSQELSMITFDKALQLKISLNEQKKDDELPELTVFALDRNKNILCSEDVCDQGQVTIPLKELNAAESIIVAPKDQELTAENIASAVSYNRSQILQIANTGGLVNLSRRNWQSLLFRTVCVDGTLKKCFWWYLLPRFNFIANAITDLSPVRPSLLGRARLESGVSDQIGDLTLFPRRCAPVCNGLVEVYERTCCFRFVIDPPLIVDICEILKDRLIEIPRVIPEVGPGIGPFPDPIPEPVLGLLKDGAEDIVRVNAAQDLKALSSLSFSDAKEYILERPYLIHLVEQCGDPIFRGVTALGANGEFSHCYSVPFTLVAPGVANCRREVAFIVKQTTDSGERVIYNGLAANQWFSPSDDIDLITYSSRAVSCDDETNEVPGPDDAYVALARIGTGTESYQLDSPIQDSASSVSGPLAATAGLAFPEANLPSGKGRKNNLNWGGSLPLRFEFSKGMEATAAKYYRISISQANALGNPIPGTQEYLDSAITWFYDEPTSVPGGFIIVKKALNLTLASDPSFHAIPYDNLIPNGAWRDNQYHGVINTTDSEKYPVNGRYLMTIELYDDDFVRVVPDNAPGMSGDNKESFTYQKWVVEENTQMVPYEALTHLFWWDNRLLTTVIEDLRLDLTANPNECQFMLGSANSTFSSGFRAFHPQNGNVNTDPDFILNWRLEWQRGLGGPLEELDSGNCSEGESTIEQSNTNTFSTMLSDGEGGLIEPPKCTFSLLLFASAKTWNGSTFIDGYSLRDVASFALEIN